MSNDDTTPRPRPTRAVGPARSVFVVAFILMMVCVSARAQQQQPSVDRFEEPPLSIPRPAGEAADDDPNDPDRASLKKDAVPIELDVLTLLQTPTPWRNLARDDFWAIRPRDNHALLTLPILVQKPAELTKINLSYVDVKGGRCLAWQLFDPYEKRPAGDKEEAKLIGKDLPPEVPFITRSFEVTPEGTLRWRLYRFMQQGDVITSGRLYAFKLSRALIEKMRPKPLNRNTKLPSDPAARRKFIETQRKAAEAYRARQKEYVELIKRVNDAPDEFEMQTPSHVWVMYEVRDNLSELRIEGVHERPWIIGRDQLNAIRKAVKQDKMVVKSADGAERLSDGVLAGVRAMNDLVTPESHPYSHRLSAYAVTRGGLYKLGGIDETLYKLLENLIKSPDRMAAIQVVKNIAIAIPTSTSEVASRGGLLKVAAAQGLLDASMQLTALKTQLQPGKSAPQQTDAVLRTANNFLRDPGGPAPADILDTLLQKAKQEPKLVPAIVNGVEFDKLPYERLQPSIAFALEQAADHPTAATWVDRRLLGSTDKRLTLQTLAVLSLANRKPDSSQAAPAQSARSVVRNILSIASQSVAPAAGVELKLTKPIPINYPGHAALKNLADNDPQINSMSWATLPHFAIVPAAPDPNAPKGAAQGDAYDAVIDMALSQSPTPLSVVEFLSKQPDASRAAWALAALVVRGDKRVSAPAAQALVGHGHPLGPVLSVLPPPERQAFASRMYDYATGSHPMVTAILGERGAKSPMADWLGQQVAAGRVPLPSEWAQAYGPNDKVIELIRSGDENLRFGAISALVAEAGGDDEVAKALAPRFDKLAGATTPELRKAWLDTRPLVHQMVVQHAAGQYRMALQLLGPAPAPGTPQTPTDPKAIVGTGGRPVTGEMVLGVTTLAVDGRSVTLGNQNISLSMPDTRQPTIRIDRPAELKNIPNDQLAKLPLESLKDPVDLTPAAGGVWRGFMPLADGRDLDVVLIPVQDK